MTIYYPHRLKRHGYVKSSTIMTNIQADVLVRIISFRNTLKPFLFNLFDSSKNFIR